SIVGFPKTRKRSFDLVGDRTGRAGAVAGFLMVPRRLAFPRPDPDEEPRPLEADEVRPPAGPPAGLAGPEGVRPRLAPRRRPDGGTLRGAHPGALPGTPSRPRVRLRPAPRSLRAPRRAERLRRLAEHDPQELEPRRRLRPHLGAAVPRRLLR